MPLLCLIFFLGLQGISGAVPPPLDPITRIAGIRSLSRSQIALSPPVRVRGVVTLLWTKGSSSWVMEDPTGGIFVSFAVALQRGVWQGDAGIPDRILPGTEVEIDGIAAPGGFAPVILPQQIRLLGRLPLPPPVPLLQESLVSGALDTHLVSTSGVIVETNPVGQTTLLRLSSPPGDFLAEIPATPALNLLGAEVQLQGIAANTYNSRGEFVSLKILSNSPDAIRILTPPPSDPFAVPATPLSGISSFSPKGPNLQRRKVRGTVTWCQPGSHLYLQDDQSSIRVRTPSREIFHPGDLIEASGFIDRSRLVAGLTNAAIRSLGPSPPLTPVPIDWPTLRRSIEPLRRGVIETAATDFDNRLVSLDARLLETQHLPDGSTRLLLSTPESTDTALLPPPASPTGQHRPTGLRPGSLLRVTGIAELEYAANPAHSREPSTPIRLSLQLRNADDIVILKPAPWWNTALLLRSIVVLAAILATAALWILLLRRMVTRQSQRLEAALRTHRDSELEMKGAREERYRLASDLHDGLQQHLSGTSYRLEAAIMRLGTLPEGVAEQFTAARAALERTRTGLRQCLLGLRDVEEGPADFPALLRHAVEKIEHWPKNAVTIQTLGQPYPLSRHVMGSLLLFMQEAVGNAFRHGAAPGTSITLHYHGDEFEFTITDNGTGFDPHQIPDASSGHFGVESMRHRLRWLGGTTDLQSTPGLGTRITARLPRNKAQARRFPGDPATESP